jgi:hypothetical protein
MTESKADTCASEAREEMYRLQSARLLSDDFWETNKRIRKLKKEWSNCAESDEEKDGLYEELKPWQSKVFKIESSI